MCLLKSKFFHELNIESIHHQKAVLDTACHVMSDPRFAPSLSGKRVGGMASGRDTGGEEHGKLASASP